MKVRDGIYNIDVMAAEFMFMNAMQRNIPCLLFIGCTSLNVPFFHQNKKVNCIQVIAIERAPQIWTRQCLVRRIVFYILIRTSGQIIVGMTYYWDWMVIRTCFSQISKTGAIYVPAYLKRDKKIQLIIDETKNGKLKGLCLALLNPSRRLKICVYLVIIKQVCLTGIIWESWMSGQQV